MSNISLRTTKTVQNYKNKLYTPRYHTARLQKSKKYQGVKIWNKIPSEIQNTSPNFFKKKFKNHLLQMQIEYIIERFLVRKS